MTKTVAETTRLCHSCLYPVEYLSYGQSSIHNITKRPINPTTGIKEYKVQDHLGSTRVVIDDTGTIINRTDNDAWGETIWQSGTETRLSYIDKEKDKESGDRNFGVRQYRDGRFLSTDPLWEKYRSLTPYHYTGNNPLMYTDPSGKAHGGAFDIQPRDISTGGMMGVGGSGGGVSIGQIIGAAVAGVLGYVFAENVVGSEAEKQAPTPAQPNNEDKTVPNPDVKTEAQKLAKEIGKNSVLLPDKTRVDLVGQPGSDQTHYNKKTGEEVPVPHTHDPIKNVNPKGQEFVKTSRDARPATPEDLARVKEFIKKNLSED